jgi:hypothetical protein
MKLLQNLYWVDSWSGAEIQKGRTSTLIWKDFQRAESHKDFVVAWKWLEKNIGHVYSFV